MDKLAQLKTMTTVVADTGDLNSIASYQPEDATTNPSLLLKAAEQTEHRELVERTVRDLKHQKTEIICDHLAVNVGVEILK
ncbi:MAG: transaldolase, partial [Gammaproteobacteria bacterium]|nr:transaldolase [Gammaproteobacteria bacterium]